MNAKCHYELGRVLVRQYIPLAPRRYRWAFIAGCTEPDKNPTTYLKGSIRSQFLRGHHWNSARRYIARLCRRLERRTKLRLQDFYALGKLMHYTADAFTYPHNDHFPGGLKAHRQYEEELRRVFSRILAEGVQAFPAQTGGMMRTISIYHSRYCRRPGTPARDTRYIAGVCSGIMGMVVLDLPVFV